MKPRDASYFSGDECRPFFYGEGDRGIVLLHGFTGSVAHMRPLGDALYERGYSVSGINLPGHASMERDMAAVGRREWLQAAKDAVNRMRKRCSFVAACGLSMGAVIALILAEENALDACVSISAPLPASNLLLPLAGLYSVVHPRITWQPDPEREKLLDQRYDKGYTGFPTSKGADLHSLIRQAQKNLGEIACPLLAVQSSGDHTVSKNSADTILSCSSSVRKEKLLLEGVPHVCTISGKLPEIVDAVDRFMQPFS